MFYLNVSQQSLRYFFALLSDTLSSLYLILKIYKHLFLFIFLFYHLLLVQLAVMAAVHEKYHQTDYKPD